MIPPDTEDFIELAIRPLAGNSELKLAAEVELRKALDEHSSGNGAALASATNAIARKYKKSRFLDWRFAVIPVMLAVSLPLLSHTITQVKRIMPIRSLFAVLSSAPTEPAFVKNLDEHGKLVLYGSPGASNEAAKWKPLWDSQPDNAVYFTCYAQAYISDHGKFTPEILASMEKIDPGNGWLHGGAACNLVEKAVSKDRTGSKPSGSKMPPVWKVDDEKRFKEALAEVHRFASMPRLVSYQKELMTERMALFPASEDLASQMDPLIYSVVQRSYTIQFWKLSDLMSAGAQEAAAAGDVEGFRRITRDWEVIVRALAENGATMVDSLVTRVMVMSPLPNFRTGARSLGLTEEADHFDALHRRMLADKDIRDKARDVSTYGITSRGSVLANVMGSMVSRQATSPPPLSEEQLKPGRYADHAFLGQILSWVAWVFLGICAGMAAVSRYIHGRLARKLSKVIQNIFRPADWVWVIAVGLVLPIVWYACITRLTPFGAREWAAGTSKFLFPACQFSALLVSMLILPPVIASWRLSKRGVFFGLAPRFPWLGWVAAAVSLASVPLTGAVRNGGEIADTSQILSFSLLGISLIWLFYSLVVAVFGSKAQILRRVTLGRLLWPVWVLGMLIVAMTVPVYHAEESHWIKQDRMFGVFPGSISAFNYENTVANAIRDEVLGLLGSKDFSR